MKPAQLSGKRFGRLLVIGPTTARRLGERWWELVCDCGNVVVASSHALIGGTTKSCGCLRVDLLIRRNTKHGARVNGQQHRFYETWRSMMARCYNKNREHYEHYGGRGIKVCREWWNAKPFLDWCDAQGAIPKGHTIDRKNNDGDYEPGNCRFASPSEQNKNRRPFPGRGRKGARGGKW